ncbi:MAG: hypothetical protein ACYC2P_01530 [Paludibacteraceae bacterium]
MRTTKYMFRITVANISLGLSNLPVSNAGLIQARRHAANKRLQQSIINNSNLSKKRTGKDENATINLI